ncbi:MULTISPECIES: TetR/AcrR family transcriptional regulator [unclassified Mesorhizobium]|uniref:TetR/AcrR family transcriptional regulator n=2 Tax=Mesorhizobium TaxID=68287 RepID=UPI000FD1FED7|nr:MULTISPECIES: TetR/AcrR family transcriptional regulator [unclassified Mesorhizobium]RUX00153.1 TetR/AcrR family transcriptional regulator [Mesorhizobium sp. M8A.F.Ca.ET.059.01.1.1]RVD55378.1 TetR/AcrR family transcriptional regulator [Mesorhizobium sp. M8A.F.Ca.ET.023.02.2.1]TGV13255.1 TetR/AcrR family transcriptional regulator [Mesorhizobium sp. M8A.F.Ca.ET.173.01.1.1]RWC70900.1 MAG: TetR/AcrR family transcriptional regulator [Mesorhizobium sp.]TGQ94223.1 TetR/AcrR family transcriptional 
MRPGVSPDTFPPRGHEAKRMSIVDAAAGVFCREGFAGANIDLIAAEAGVSRQTVYNHHRDKEKLFIAVVRDLTERCNAGIFATIATFPDQPGDLEADLIGFAVRLNQNCICNRDGKFLRKLIQTEGERYPELFAEWREQGPGRTWPAIAARFARLAYGGHLTIDDPDVAARQFLGLVNAELQTTFMLGGTPREDEVVQSATNGVRTFLRAFGKRPSAIGAKKHTALANA